jgi:hypothetical protein
MLSKQQKYDHSHSFGIDNDGTYSASREFVDGHGKGSFTKGDVVGCGLLVLPAERRLFFTKNGEVWGKYYIKMSVVNMLSINIYFSKI